MKTTISMGIFTVLVLLFSCINDNTAHGTGIFQNLSAGEFAGKIKDMGRDKYLILDVRTKAEFDQLHLTDAINIDFYASDFKTQIDSLDKTKTFFVYCRSGNRSGKTMALMKELGFKKVYNLAGGIITDTRELPLAESD